MPAAVFPLVIEQYADLLVQFTWYDANNALVPLTGYTAKMMVRDFKGGTLLQDFTVAPATLTINTVNSTITAFAPGATTGAYTWSTGYYDLTLTSAINNIYRLIEGPVTVHTGVSH